MTPECRSFFCPFQWVPVLALIHSLTLLFGRLDRWLACFRLSPSAYVQLLRHACNWPTGFCIRPVEIQCSVISIISFCRSRWATVQISGLPVIVREIVLPHKSQLFMRCQLDSNGSRSVTLDTRGSSRLRREFSVLAEGRHIFGPRSKPRAAKPREKLFAQVTIFV